MGGDERLAVADRIAEAVISAVPFRLGAARTDGEREEVFRLRYRVVQEMGWASPRELEEEMEREERDEEAIHACAWRDTELVGTSRVVLPDVERPLPIEEEFGLTVEPRGKVVEVGRTAIVPDLRGDSGHGLLMAVFGQCWLELRGEGFSDLISASPERLITLYRSLGFKVLVLADGRPHWGEERFPVRFDIRGSARSLASQWGV